MENNTKTITFSEEELELIDQALSYTFKDQFEKAKKFKLFSSKKKRIIKSKKFDKLCDKIFDTPYNK